MCRWAAYTGAPLFLSDMIAEPTHSLVNQSLSAEECKTAVNADGFGLAWYAHRPEPGLFRDVYPAWSDPNLQSIARQVKSGMFLVHVRASTETATSRNNCHPFALGRWSFMHNGQVGGFGSFRKKADMLITDALYEHRKGATDSETLFLLAAGAGLDTDPQRALEHAVHQLETLSIRHGMAPHMRLSVAFSDGKTLYAARYASDDKSPSLYYRWKENWQGWAIVSELFDADHEGWTAVAPGTFCSFGPDGVSTSHFASRRWDDPAASRARPPRHQKVA
ncbi:class II glutamine amidotransferase [uncultured Tateyamaria sp.]|uniref:class II glutamine amidotransferase n=1 Tax=uncultured Tateyamaria sp. TaxID=455651 RepID=UPI002636F479|nr:class II glutamine amidotransferase [uncultured Tateyamaria sp.]